jgi:hypothetical protein
MAGKSGKSKAHKQSKKHHRPDPPIVEAPVVPPKIPKSRVLASKKTLPFWQSTPFVLSVVAILMSILVSWEPVAQKVDELLGTTTSRKARGLEGLSLMDQAAVEWCYTHPEICREEPPADPHTSFPVTLINQSPYRVDIYWDNTDSNPDDDTSIGQVIHHLDGNGASVSLTVFRDNKFFITRHGVKELLFDPTTDQQHTFTTMRPGQTFVIPANAAPSATKCRDRFPKPCTKYAQAGQCWDNPGWMIVNCCGSCETYSPTLQASTLLDSNVRCTKEMMNITEPIWQPGDLDALFQKWSTDPAFAHYEPQVLSSPSTTKDANGQPGPWVMIFDNFFSEEEAQALIEGGRMAGFDRSTNQGNVNALGEMEMVTSTTRTSSNAWCLGACQQLPGVRTMTQRIEAVTGIPEQNYEPFQVLEYQDAQFYKMHHDSEGRDLKPPGNRILTFFLYLSNVEEGGETKFNQLGLEVKPKLGRALVWPSVLNEDPGFWDDRMYHEAMPVIQGKKYAANHWIHLNDYEGPNKWGCTGSFE